MKAIENATSPVCNITVCPLCGFFACICADAFREEAKLAPKFEPLPWWAAQDQVFTEYLNMVTSK